MKHFLKLPDMPGIEKFTKTTRRRYTGQQLGTKSAHGPTDKSLVNRWLCSIGLHRNSSVRASGESSRRVVFDDLERNGNG